MATCPFLVACDKAPSNAFRALTEYYAAYLFAKPLAILLDGARLAPPTKRDIENLVWKSDVVLVGMSSFPGNAAVEISAAETAIRFNRPFGLYADTPGAEARKHFSHLRTDAAFVFVVTEGEVAAARRLYPNARIVATGNPEWASFFLPAKIDPVQMQLAPERQSIVYVPFTKTASVNIAKARMAVEAVVAAHVAGEDRFRVILNRHPGDKDTPQSRYDDALAEYPTHLYTFTDMKSLDILPATDILIGPASSTNMHAMARQIPIFDVMNEEIESWLESDIGDTRTYASRKGGSIEVRSPMELARYLAATRGTGISVNDTHVARVLDMKSRQHSIVPHSAVGEAVQKMSDFLCSV